MRYRDDPDYNAALPPRSASLLIRLIHGTGVALLLGCLAVWLGARTTPALQTASDLAGERWFRLLLNDAQVGYLHTHSYRDRRGAFHFTSDLRFVLDPGNPVRIRERLEFEPAPPFALRFAEQRQQRGGATEGTRIDAGPAGYRAVSLAGGGGGAESAADWTFTLADYLGFEIWLREVAPGPDAAASVRTLDFGRREVVQRRFRVLEKNLTGYRVENTAPLDATHIQLDERLQPVSLSLSGLFQLERTSRDRALAPRTALHTGSYFVPADRALRDHTAIRTLELELTGDAATAQLWPERTTAGERTLRLEANPVSTQALRGDELAETSQHPIHDPRIRALARRAVAGATEARAQVAALTGFVHGYLSYHEQGAPKHVLALLDDPGGDCTEYADLLTTLARALGIPSRTVFGLAYADQRPPAFRFHAWNELQVDGQWLAVDPTWNQLRVDATHIPLPGNVGAALQVLTGAGNLGFVIREATYF